MHHNDIVPDDVIIDSFKILSRQRRSPHRKHEKRELEAHLKPAEDIPQPEVVPIAQAQPTIARELAVEEILMSRKSTSHSLFSSTHRSDSHDDSRNFSKGDDVSFSAGSTVSRGGAGSAAKKFFVQHFGFKSSDNKESRKGRNDERDDDDDENLRRPSSDGEYTSGDKKKRQSTKKKPGDDDRRKSTWIPCTCPQYKVSKDLAIRKDVQAIFFAKLMVIKVVQLLIINLVVFSVAYERETTIDFFKKSHDWVYLAYALFVALLVCIRVGTSYRARWHPVISFLAMIPLTAIIAFTSACIAVVYNSVLVPLIVCTLLLSFLMLCFAPYLLRKYVMSRVTNFMASGLTLLCSIILIFLKEFEPSTMTYWQFIARIWLPAMVLSQIIVQASIIEIQRMLFGLCFNLSSKRWHIAAMYL